MKLFLTIILIISLNAIQAQYTAIPDVNFEQELINQGIDSEHTLDGQVLTSDINTITSLTIQNTDIGHMTGIQDFIALTDLIIFDNENLTLLDLSNNISLTSLSCNNNLSLNLDVESITTNLEYLSCNHISLFGDLDIGNKPNLNFLDCGGNFLSNLDISQCPNLEILFCNSTSISNLNILQNPDLWFINASMNNINEIDLSVNLNLKTLFIWSNNLETINLNKNIVLEQLYCGNNNLTSVYIQNNANELITNFDTINNPNLTCIYVDDTQYSTTNWTEIDNNSTFVETEAECEALTIAEETIASISIYPNPIKDKITITSPIGIKIVIVYDLLGKAVITTNKNEVNVSTLANSIYIVKVVTNDGKITSKKIIKS